MGEVLDETAADRIGDLHEYDRDATGGLQHRPGGWTADGQQDVGRKCDQLRRILARALGLAGTPADVDARVASLAPAQLPQLLQESGEARLPRRIFGHEIEQHADAPPALSLLRPRRQRPRRRRAAEQRDELAAPDHSITSSAVESSVAGKVRPSMPAVPALMTSSNLVDCTTGRSAGLAPLRMRPT